MVEWRPNQPGNGEAGPVYMAASGVVECSREPWTTALPLPWAHLLHAAPSHGGEGIRHQSGAQASEQPYLPIHLYNVLGYKKESRRGNVLPSPDTPTPGSQSHPDQMQPVRQ